MLVAVDFDLMFTYVSAGWEDSAHDSTVLIHSLDHQNGLHALEGLRRMLHISQLNFAKWGS